MTVPTRQEYRATALGAANAGLLVDLTAEGADGCAVNLYTAADVLLVSVPLADPPGAVNGTTGALELQPANASEIAVAGGTAAYAELLDADGQWVTRLPVEQGNAPNRGKVVINQTFVLAGSIIAFTSLEIG
jgi:hypothetical protein